MLCRTYAVVISLLLTAGCSACNSRDSVSGVIASQLPVEHWHAWIGDASIADAILDRLLSRSHRLALKGKSLRAQRPGAGNSSNGGSDTVGAAS